MFVTFLHALNLLYFLANHIWPFHLPFIPKHSKRQIRHQQALSQTPHKRNGIEEVGVAASSIDPQVIKRRAEESCVQKRSGRDVGISHKREDVPEQGEHGKEQARICDGGIRFEDGKDAQEDSQHGKRLGANADRETAHVGGEMEPEHGEEKGPEGVEHLDEEVPP